MIASSPPDHAALIARLEEAAAHVARLEQEADTALHEAKNESAYRRIMREKAVFLSGLPEAFAPLLTDAPPAALAVIQPDLDNFAQGALTALSLNSVFYMSALLHPTCPAPGDPNNLEILIRKLKESSC
jgi:hypothetical protein